MQIYCFRNPAHLFERLVLRKEVANAHKDVEKRESFSTFDGNELI